MDEFDSQWIENLLDEEFDDEVWGGRLDEFLSSDENVYEKSFR